MPGKPGILERRFTMDDFILREVQEINDIMKEIRKLLEEIRELI